MTTIPDLNATKQARIDPLWCKGFGQAKNCTNCHVKYTGEWCEIDIYYDDLPFMIYMALFQVGLFSAFLVTLGWIILGAVERVVNKLGLFNMYGGVMLINILFILTRFFYFLDPNGFYKLWNAELEVANTWISNILFVCSMTMSISLWFDIVSSIDRTRTSFRAGKIITLLLSIAVFLFSTTIYVLFATVFRDYSGTGYLTLTILIGLFVVAVILMAFTVVPKVSKLVSGMKGASKLPKVFVYVYLIIRSCFG